MFKILVTEDDCALNRSVCAYLDANGFEATGCLNADDACDKLFEGVYDLIISDIMMPGTDGFAFAEEVRDFNKDIPILFMTARGDIEAKRRGFRIGIDDYVEKPVDLEELKMRIGALLRCSDFSLFAVDGLPYAEIFNAAHTQSGRLKPYRIQLPSAILYAANV